MACPIPSAIDARSKKPRALARGFCASLMTRPCLVRCAPRASPVEPPDQLAADGLHEFLAIHRQVGAGSARISYDQEVILVIGREAIFGSPEETGQPTKVVLKAAPEKPARIGMLVNSEASGIRRVSEKCQINARKSCLGEAATDVGEHCRRDQVANAAAHRPCRLQRLSPTNDVAVERGSEVAVDAGEIIVAKYANDPAPADLVITAATHGAKPSATAGPDLCARLDGVLKA